MKLFDFKYIEDFGHELYFSVLRGKHRSLIQISLSWTDFPSWPYIQVSSGSGRLFSILFWIYKFGFDIDIIAYNWIGKYD